MVTLARRVVRFLKKRGYFQDQRNDEAERAILPDEEMQQEELLLPELQAASVQSRIALGERRGQRVRRLGAIESSRFEPVLKAPLVAATEGFSLHAAIYCAPYEREKLEKLCRYITRPAVSENRLTMKSSGDIVLKLKSKYSDGTSHLLFSGLEFVDKLAALVPPPRIHLTRYFGCLAPHAKIRSQIVPKNAPQKADAESRKETDPGDSEAVPIKKKRMGWAALLARVFAIDMEHCPECGSEDFKPIAAILEISAIKKILTHLGLPDKPPDIAPARLPDQMCFE